MSEITTFRRRLLAAGVILAGSGALSGCSDAPVDYEGIGNEFIVRAVVSDSEEDGLVQAPENQFVVLAANGKAKSHFPNPADSGLSVGEVDFLQRYSKEPRGFLSCGDDVYVGEVFDSNGGRIAPEDLQPGDVIEIEGHIRQSMYWQSTGKSGYCNEEDLAVYETIRIVEGTLNR